MSDEKRKAARKRIEELKAQIRQLEEQARRKALRVEVDARRRDAR